MPHGGHGEARRTSARVSRLNYDVQTLMSYYTAVLLSHPAIEPCPVRGTCGAGCRARGDGARAGGGGRARRGDRAARRGGTSPPRRTRDLFDRSSVAASRDVRVPATVWSSKLRESLVAHLRRPPSCNRSPQPCCVQPLLPSRLGAALSRWGWRRHAATAPQKRSATAVATHATRNATVACARQTGA